MKSIQRCILFMATILIIYSASADSAPPATAGEWTLTLTAGENTAYRNGEAFELAGKPYIQDHTFYVPLQEVTEALGGTYREYSDTAKVEFSAYTAEIPCREKQLCSKRRRHRCRCSCQMLSGRRERDVL